MDDFRHLLRIGDFAKRVGVSISAIRKYEVAGLVLPVRESSGYRYYLPMDVDWLIQVGEFTARKNVSLRFVANLLRLLPRNQIREHHGLGPCNVVVNDGPCWTASLQNPDLRPECLQCPVYHTKHTVLDFDRHYAVVLRK